MRYTQRHTIPEENIERLNVPYQEVVLSALDQEFAKFIGKHYEVEEEIEGPNRAFRRELVILHPSQVTHIYGMLSGLLISHPQFTGIVEEIMQEFSK